jgi:hypothetical protein
MILPILFLRNAPVDSPRIFPIRMAPLLMKKSGTPQRPMQLIAAASHQEKCPEAPYPALRMAPLMWTPKTRHMATARMRSGQKRRDEDGIGRLK